MQLDDLVFKVNTTDIERANKLMQELGASIQTLDKKIADTSNKQSLVEARQARAAKDTARARLENAKAVDVETKAEERKQKTIDKTTVAQEKAVQADKKKAEQVDRVTAALQKQNDINDYLLQGFSRGEAQRLAQLKSLGAVNEQLKEYAELLNIPRKLVSDPFDNSASGASKASKELTLLKDVYRMTTAEIDITAKQMRELTKDKLRSIEVAKAEGKSIFSVREEIRNANAAYIETATSINKYAQVEKAANQARKDSASATRALAQEDERMAAALNTVNASMSRANTDSLVKYESNLRRVGLSQEAFTAKLAAYKNQLQQVQAQEEKRSQQHLARALSPQLTDIAVSLYSGQAPLTVLLQQGGQIADLFRLSGVEAQNFGKAMKDAFSSMIPVIATVATGMAQFAKAIVVDAAGAVVKLATDMTGLGVVTDMTVNKLNTMGKVGETLASILVRLTALVAGALTVGIVAAGAAVVGLALGFKQAMDRQDELARAMALGGATMGVTHGQAIALAGSMEGVGVSTGKAITVISEMAKSSTFLTEDIVKVTKAAVELEKYGGVAIEGTVKNFEKMREKPVEALLELQKQTGRVSEEAIKSASEFMKQGEAARAAGVAMDEYARVTDGTVAKMKDNLSGFAKVVISIGSSIKNFFSNAFQSLWYATDPSQQLAELEKNVDQLRKRTINGNAIDDRNLRIAEKALADYRIKVNKETEEAKLAQTKATNAAVESELLKLDKKLEDSADKRNNKTKTLSQYTEDYIKKKREDIAVSAMANAEDVKFSDAQIKALTEQAAAEYKKLQGKKKVSAEQKQATKDLEVYTDLLNVADGLSTKYNNTLEALQRQRANGVISEEAYVAAVEKLIQMQPFAIKQAEDLAKAQELEAKLLDRVNGKGADYTKTLKQIEEASKFMLNGQLYFSPEDIQKMKENLEKLTPEYKKQQKAIEDAQKAYNKYADDVQKSLDNTQVENSKLDDRVALLGLTANEQEKLSKQQDINNKLLAVDLKMRREILKIQADQKLAADPIAQLAAIKEVEYAAAEERKMLNRQVAIQAAEDLDKEYRKIKEGLSDSIVTALFEGGKEGAKKLRNVVINALRDPVTVVVNALVNVVGAGASDLLSSLIGGGSSGGSVGSAASAIMNGFNVASGAGKTLLNSTWFQNLGNEAIKEMLGQFGAGLMNTSSWSAASQSFQAGGAQMAGVIVGSVMNGFAGYNLSRAISGGYSAGSWVNTVAGIASMIPGIGPIAGLVGGVVNRLFGRKLKDTGIEGEFGGETGFEGNSYQFYKGGAFRSNKTRRQKLDEATRSGFADQFTVLKGSIGAMGEALGLGSDLLKDFTYKFKVSLKGLSEEDAAKKIEEEFNKMAEAMGGVVLVSTEYTREGETQLQALTRLSTSLVGVNAMLDTLGIKMYETSLAGADMASSLVDLFGDLETMQAAVTSYYDAYYSEEEKKATLTRQLTAQFKEQNLELPKSREEYRKLVESLDLTTEEGRKMYAFLITLSPTFAMIADSTEDLVAKAKALAEEIQSKQFDLDNELLRAQGNEQEAVNRERAKELEALRELDPKLAATQEEIWRLNDANAAAAKAAKEAADAEAARVKAQQEAERLREEAISKAMQALQKAVAKEKEALQERINSTQEVINTLQALFDLLGNSIKTLYNQVDATSRMSYLTARNIIGSAVSTVRAGGDVSSIDGLDVAINDVMAGLSADNYSTKVEYDRERLRLADELSALKNSAKRELTNAEKQLASLNDQVKRLDSILEYWQMQIDISNGTYTGVLSVTAAIKALETALTTKTTNSGGSGSAGGSTSGDPWKDPIYTPGSGGATVGGIDPNGTRVYTIGYTKDGRAIYSDGTTEEYTPGNNVWDGNQLVGTGSLTKEQWERLQAGQNPFPGSNSTSGGYVWSDSQNMYVKAYAEGGSYRGGLALVGEEGPELINFNQGGHVSTASQTSAMLEGSAQRVAILESAVVALVKKLDDVATNTRRTSEILRNITPNGDGINAYPVTEDS